MTLEPLEVQRGSSQVPAVAVAATMDLYDYRRSGKTAEELGWFEWPPACDIWNRDEQESACERSCISKEEFSGRPEKSAALRVTWKVTWKEARWQRASLIQRSDRSPAHTSSPTNGLR